MPMQTFFMPLQTELLTLHSQSLVATGELLTLHSQFLLTTADPVSDMLQILPLTIADPILHHHASHLLLSLMCSFRSDATIS